MTNSNAQGGSRLQTNGLLALNSSQISGSSHRSPAVRPSAPRLKVIIRRLPPGLTQEEFTNTLGDEWKIGRGRVDWFLFKPGKDSKDPSKPSRPCRAYLHLTNESHLLDLLDVVRQSTFEDAQNTYSNPCLIGPPTVEFAPYGRTPGNRARTDTRAGTIDQDPEFMAFLEGLANPSKETNMEPLPEVTSKPLKVTTTPLVQFIKDKKANKSKEAAGKAAKKQETQSGKGKVKKDAMSVDDAKKVKDGKVDKLLEKAGKEAVRILNREATSKPVTGSSSQSSEPTNSEKGTPKLDITKVPGRQRGAIIAAHIRMLQRDLGLSPAQAHRQVRRDTADSQRAERAAAAEKVITTLKEPNPQHEHGQLAPTAPKGNSNVSSNKKARGKAPTHDSEISNSIDSSISTPTTTRSSNPVALLKKAEGSRPARERSIPPGKSTPAGPSRKNSPVAVPSQGATQAFVKHANPSQGVTEPLLKEAMEKFGAVSTVEIDKRKGFAYVNFVESVGLKKAMAANPIPVAQGTVQVMQRKGTALPPEKKVIHQASQPSARGSRGGRGGRRGGRGASRGASNSASSENSKPSTSASTAAVAK